MSNGDSLDDFVFPPFIPTASTRPAQSPPSPPTQDAAPPAEPSPAVDGWLAETFADAAPAQPEPSAADEGDDLPWLEVPAPREEPAPVAAAPADDAFPDWMAWDQRDESAAEADARDAVAPVAGLEEFLTADDLAHASPPPSVTWTDAEPDAAPVTDFAFDEEPAAAASSPSAEPFPDFSFDEEPPAAPAASADEPWAIDAIAPTDSTASAESATPADWVDSIDSVDAVAPVDSADSVDSVEAPSFAAWQGASASAEEGGASEEGTGTESDYAPASIAEPPPFIADEEAVMAAEPQPSLTEDTSATPPPIDAVTPDSVAPTASAGSPFEDVAGRLEAIARTLRERPDELLAGGSSDPLALLVTGYVMGYTARGR